MTIEKLKEYCKRHNIWLPKGHLSKYIIECFIARAWLNGSKIEPKNGSNGSCFGYWENENSNCMTCGKEEKCFESSIGMSKEEYFKKYEKADEIPDFETRKK